MTPDEWRNVLMADTGMAMIALIGAWWLWRHGARGVAVTAAFALAIPVSLGLGFLHSDLTDEYQECTLACYNAYESHWLGWSLGSFAAGAVLAPTLLVTGILHWRRRSRQAAQ